MPDAPLTREQLLAAFPLGPDSLPQAAQLQELAVERIIPIQHTIKIEPIP